MGNARNRFLILALALLLTGPSFGRILAPSGLKVLNIAVRFERTTGETGIKTANYTHGCSTGVKWGKSTPDVQTTKFRRKPRVTHTRHRSRAVGPVRHYTNSEGENVQSPTYYDEKPDGATAVCNDGTYSFSQSRRGTCSHHGGVRSWL